MNPYTINKGINAPLVFKGLKAQYIAYLAVGLVVLLVLCFGRSPLLRGLSLFR